MSYNGRDVAHFSNGDVDTIMRMAQRRQEHRMRQEAYFRDLEERERKWCTDYLDQRYKTFLGEVDTERECGNARKAFNHANENAALAIFENPYESRGEWYPQFLNVLRVTGNMRAACHAVGIERRVALFHYANDNAFASRWDEAIEDALDTLDAVAWKRAREGSDSLLRFLLERRRPELYGEKKEIRVKTEVTGPIDMEEVNEDPRIAAKILQVLRDAGALDSDDSEEDIIDSTSVEVELDA
jgi:hypothetical protein